MSVSDISIGRQRNPLRRRSRCRRILSAALLVLASFMAQFRSNYWDYFLPKTLDPTALKRGRSGQIHVSFWS
jgi:hypothetical protein